MSEKPAAYPLVVYPTGWFDKGFVVTDEGFGGSTYLVGNFGPHGPHLFAAAPDMREALEDALSGWRYIREVHGDLSGVGWDRVESAARAALAKAKGEGA